MTNLIVNKVKVVWYHTKFLRKGVLNVDLANAVIGNGKTIPKIFQIDMYSNYMSTP